jgi:mannose-6-phosphate isomerase-like protein (cupin superfamily)
MLTFKHYRSGSLYGIQYRFTCPGEALPEHAHDETTAHNIIVMQGQVNLTFDNGDFQTLNAGDICDFDCSRPHRIIASGPAVIINFYLNGMPEGYDRLQLSELDGVIES